MPSDTRSCFVPVQPGVLSKTVALAGLATSAAFFKHEQPQLQAAAAGDLPTFPDGWSADYGEKLVLWQGGSYNKTDGTACCEVGTPQCKVQAQGVSGTMYTDGANNRSTLSVGQQAIVNLYHPINMQISAVPSASGKGWTCQSYCPIDDGPFPNDLAIDKSAKDVGSSTVLGKKVEQYQWFDELFHVVKMDEQNHYVDMKDPAHPVPVLTETKLTPFGGAQIAEETGEYDSFNASTPAASNFAVDNLHDKSTCAVSDQCQQDTDLRRAARNAMAPKGARSLYQLAKEHAAKLIAAVSSAPTATKQRAGAASWPKDWSAHEDSEMVINQGGVTSADGKSICCTASFAGQCQVQLQSQEGDKYFDASHNRTRFEGGGGVEVDDYNSHMAMDVVHNGTHDVCNKYCPIDPDDTLDVGKNEFLDDNATDLGAATYQGKPAEHYQWKETIFKVVVMQTSDFYADQSGASVVPMGRVDHLTPFGGPQIGKSTIAWDNFKAGAQPADKFDIQGTKNCPVDPQCGQQKYQLRRLAAGQLHTFARYAQLVNQEK